MSSSGARFGSPAHRLDNAWRLYDAHVEWIKHADALTFVFIVGVERWLATTVVRVAKVALLIAACPLGPKAVLSKQPSSFLFFAHTASKHPTVGTYRPTHEST